MKNKLFLLLIISFSIIFISCGSSDNNDVKLELGNVFVSSNLTPIIGIYDFTGSSNEPESLQFGISSSDSDGIYYDSASDRLFLASRSNNRVEVYSGLTETELNANLTLEVSSSQDFSNARKLTVSGNNIIISQDAGPSNNEENRFFVYTFNNGSLTLANTYDPQINLWDVQFAGGTAYAIQDNSDTLAVFNNLLNKNSGVVTADQKVQIEGIVRTHAQYYSVSEDIMFLSDIGDADSGTDGAIHIIADFSTKLSAAGVNGMIALSDQIVIKGSNTELGNPVGLSYDVDNEKIYVAERKVEGGKLLEFDLPSTGGNLSPSSSINFSGAAAVYFSN